MSGILLAATIAAGVGLFTASGSVAAPASGLSLGEAAANASIIDQAQRCRCVERRWNGSCKLRVCRDHW
jgi:hypothetical protein